MTGDIFISYRREDSQAYAGRLFDRLEQAFGREHVFLDVDAIEPGLDFVEVLNARLHSCVAILVVIGPNWSEVVGPDGRRRLDDPNDYVRLEIEIALQRSIRTIPVLVGGASMPVRDRVPDTLGKLVTRQAARLTHERFSSDAGALIETLWKVTNGASPSPSPRQLQAPSARQSATDVAPQAAKTPTTPRGASEWTARWDKKPSMLGWSLRLAKAGRKHLLEGNLDGLILDGRKVADQPVKLEFDLYFQIAPDDFKLSATVGMFFPKSIELFVNGQALISWTKS